MAHYCGWVQGQQGGLKKQNNAGTNETATAVWGKKWWVVQANKGHSEPFEWPGV
jgi:hypothetical protein